MANESSYAAYLSTGGRVARVLAKALHVNLYDPSGLRALMEFKPFPGMESTATMNVPKIARGTVMAAATTEISGGFSNTLPTSTNFDITIARYGAKIQPTDLFQFTGGALDVDYMIGILVESLDLTLTDLLTSNFANIAGNVGTSGVDMTEDDFFDAIYYLNLQNNPKQLACVLHNQQINDFIESVRGASGPIQFKEDAQGLLMSPGVGFRGSYAGVAIYQSDSVPTANAAADRQGCMFSAGAFAYSLGPVANLGLMVNPADIVAGTPELFVERKRDADNGMTSFIVNAYPGTAEQEDLRGVRITTDA